MKRGLNLVIAALFIWTALSFPLPSYAAEKLGYVDLSRLFDEYGKTKDYDKVLEEKQKLYESERDAKVKEIKGLQDKYNLLSEKEKEKQRDSLEKKVQSYQQSDQQKQTDLRKERDEKIKEILKDIEEAIRQYAEKENYTFVFNDRVLVYQDKSLDITDKISDILAKSYTAKK
jgi:outer membrane protein